MSSRKYITRPGWLFVDIEKPSAEDLSKYNEDTGEFGFGGDAARVFKKATILYTSNGSEFPEGSKWIMGEAPGIKINFFGEQLIAIQEKDLYAQIL